MRFLTNLIDLIKAEGMFDSPASKRDTGSDSSVSIKRDSGKGGIDKSLNSKIMAMLKQEEEDKSGKVKLKKGGLVKKTATPAAKSRTNALNKFYGK